jgi:quercetin dioxygenase-like cupin family protein
LKAVSKSEAGTPVLLRLITQQPTPEIHVPGLTIEWVLHDSTLIVPAGKQEFIVSRNGGNDAWGVGRAGMHYRDLIPGRFGGRFIASHIRIQEGGPVPDYVHFHRVRFQMIFCKSGWVKVVYEGQGEPFVMQAGDCVLQPPQIRHRVLEASAGLEVIELGCPAVHETHADHQMTLPTLHHQPERSFDGQRFVRHVAADAGWQAWKWLGSDTRGFEMRDTGIKPATENLASARVVRGHAGGTTVPASHDGELVFVFVLKGELQLQGDAIAQQALQEGDCATVPAGQAVALKVQAQVEFLEVTLPAM